MRIQLSALVKTRGPRYEHDHDLNDETQRGLERVSLASGIPGEEIASKAVTSYIEDLEDASEAEAVLGRIERGEESVISLEELERRLGLDG